MSKPGTPTPSATPSGGGSHPPTRETSAKTERTASAGTASADKKSSHVSGEKLSSASKRSRASSEIGSLQTGSAHTGSAQLSKRSKISEDQSLFSTCFEDEDSCGLCGQGIETTPCISCGNYCHTKCIIAFCCMIGEKLNLDEWQCPKCVTIAHMNDKNQRKGKTCKDKKEKKRGRSDRRDSYLDGSERSGSERSGSERSGSERRGSGSGEEGSERIGSQTDDLEDRRHKDCEFCIQEANIDKCKCDTCLACYNYLSSNYPIKLRNPEFGKSNACLAYQYRQLSEGSVDVCCPCAEYDFDADSDVEFNRRLNAAKYNNEPICFCQGNICWSFVWLFTLIFAGIPLAVCCAFLYILCHCCAACFPECECAANLFLRGVKFPYECVRGVMCGTPMC